MDVETAGSKPVLVVRPEDGAASTCVELRLEDRSISRLWLNHFTLKIGAAWVRMDGIGGVGTDEAYRNCGYSRRVLEAAVDTMQRGDAALSMLYGIRDFYPKFGFATAGPDHLVLLTDLRRDNALPEGWSVDSFTARDLPAVQALYDRNTADACGAVVRPGEGGIWSRLLKDAKALGPEGCRVVKDPDGKVRAYLWRARWCWYVQHVLETNYKDALALGEVMADGPVSSDAALAACRLWAREIAAEPAVTQVVLAFPPVGPLAAAAMRQDARFLRNYSACGGSMARVVSVERLLQALLPEFRARLKAAQNNFTGTLLFHTNLGSAALRITPEEMTIEPVDQQDGLPIELPQTELARLALGAFPPGDLLARLPARPSDATVRLLEILFPLRHPHMYLPDRY